MERSEMELSEMQLSEKKRNVELLVSLRWMEILDFQPLVDVPGFWQH